VADIRKEVEKRTCLHDALLWYMRKDVVKVHIYLMICLYLGEVREKNTFT